VATSTYRPKTLLAIEVQVPTSIPPSTSVATSTKSIVSHHRKSKQKILRHVITRRSIDWKLVDCVFDPMHARFNITLEGCADDEGLNSHGD
jgi:hypothetical protein